MKEVTSISPFSVEQEGKSLPLLWAQDTLPSVTLNCQLNEDQPQHLSKRRFTDLTGRARLGSVLIFWGYCSKSPLTGSVHSLSRNSGGLNPKIKVWAGLCSLQRVQRRIFPASSSSQHLWAFSDPRPHPSSLCLHLHVACFPESLCLFFVSYRDILLGFKIQSDCILTNSICKDPISK